MNKKHLFYYALIMCASAAGLTGCDGGENEDTPIFHLVPRTHETPDAGVVMNSTLHCQIDSDCEGARFCYYGVCTAECDADSPCATGKTCSPKGRCLAAKSTRDGEDTEAKSDVEIPQIDVKFISKPASSVKVPTGAEGIEVSMRLSKDEGNISYVITSAEAKGGIESYTDEKLRIAEAEVETAEGAAKGTALYRFRIQGEELGKSSLGAEHGESQRVRLLTSVGTFFMELQPMPEVSGLYDGQVSARQFGGTALPIRFGLEIEPKYATKIEDVTGIYLYMPSSTTDLLSPDVANADGEVTWSKIKMIKETSPANCNSLSLCWSANYSTKDYTAPNSALIKPEHMINRAIRIEIDDIDATRGAVHGYARDIMSGLYRKTDSTGNPVWGRAFMEGRISLFNQDKFTTDDKTINEHISYNPQEDNEVTENLRNEEGLRPIDSLPAHICTSETLNTFLGFACEGDTSCTCSNITLDDFDRIINSTDPADSDTKAQYLLCMNTAADTILKDENLISKIITGLMAIDQDTAVEPVGGFDSLKAFLEDCASDKDTSVCKDRPELVCAVDLIGRAYIASTNNDDTADLELLGKWHQLMRESYLGNQFSAWHLDVDIRKQWLEGGEVPQFIANLLANMNKGLLEEWEKDVLNAHLNVVHKQFTQTALEVLTRVNTSAEVTASRDVVLSEYAQGWEGLGDTLALGLKRYNALLENTVDRKNKAAEMQAYLLDMYYVGLIESAINLETENSSLNSTYGKNLYENVTNIRNLNQSFDDLVFMRDAEVVVSHSLEEGSNNKSVLSKRKTLAQETLTRAETLRDTVFKEHEAKEINQASINATLTNHVDSLRSEIITLCGMPDKDCDNSEDETCKPLIQADYCGFRLSQKDGTYVKGSLDRNMGDLKLSGTIVSDTSVLSTCKSESNGGQMKCESDTGNITATDYATDLKSEVNISTAADAITAYRAANVDLDIAQADYDALVGKINITLETCDSYAKKLEKWHEKRQELMASVKNNIKIINEHYDNITGAESQILTEEAAALDAAYNAQSAGVTQWKNTTSTYWCGNNGVMKDDGTCSEEGSDSAKNRIYTIEDLAQTQSIMGFTGEAAMVAAETAAAYFDNDASSLGGLASNLAGGAAMTAGAIVWAATGATSMACEIAQISQEAKLQVKEMEYGFEVELADRKAEEAVAKAEADLAQKFNQMVINKDCTSGDNTSRDCYPVVTCSCSDSNDSTIQDSIDSLGQMAECPESCTQTTTYYSLGLQQYILQEQNAIDTLDEVNDTMRELFEIQDVYDRDLADLDFKRSEALKLIQDLPMKAAQVEKALIKKVQAQNNYYAIVQRAALLQSQYDSAVERLAKLNNLYSTPASIFAYASDLEIVENQIELAKERIYDYVAAVEYTAVRPFVDLRRATYLARSVKDLNAIINQLDTVIEECGGMTTTNKVTLSAREKLGITSDYEGMSRGERFRILMEKGNIPVSAMTRYSIADGNVKDLLNSGRDLRAGTFELKISEYANLAATCNARIASIAIQLVGDGLIEEGAKIVPTMTLFYDGQTQLASCQPNIDTLVETLGPKTSYGKYSTFIVTPTKISPTAGINEFGEPNVHLAGNPLATTYTLLIDTGIGENANVNWDKLEDIQLEITYTYQDLFSSTSKCANF